MSASSITPEPIRPRIRLRPKVDAKRIRHGFPWAYANEVVTDRRTRGITPGSLAVLEDENRAEIGLVAGRSFHRL